MVYLTCEGGKANAIEWIPASLGFLCTVVSAVKATPVEWEAGYLKASAGEFGMVWKDSALCIKTAKTRQVQMDRRVFQ